MRRAFLLLVPALVLAAVPQGAEAHYIGCSGDPEFVETCILLCETTHVGPGGHGCFVWGADGKLVPNLVQAVRLIDWW